MGKDWTIRTAWKLAALDAKEALIPLGLSAVEATSAAGVTALEGARDQGEGRQPGHVRWSQQPGSVHLGDQHCRSASPGCGMSSPTRW